LNRPVSILSALHYCGIINQIEAVYAQADLVQQVFVYGDSYQHELVAVVVPEPEAVGKWAKANGVQLDSSDGEAVSKCDKLKEAVLAQIKEVSKKNKLHGFETAKAVYLR
jgi:long-chain acyl-CoA synthetase